MNTLTELLQQSFIENAFMAGTLIAIVSAIVGYFVVLRAQAFAAHALSHVGFAGATFAALVGVSGLLGMLNVMTDYNLPADYIKKEEAYVKGLTVEKQLQITNKYIDPSKMYYVVVGDAKTQMEPLGAVGLGTPVLFKP